MPHICFTPASEGTAAADTAGTAAGSAAPEERGYMAERAPGTGFAAPG